MASNPGSVGVVVLFAFVVAVPAWPLALPMADQSGQPQAPPPGAISGVVVDAISGQPLPGATVSLARIGTPGVPVVGSPTPNPRVVTDSKGRFVYANLTPADDYFLGARAPGYEYTRYGWTAPDQSLTINDILRISVAPTQWVADIKIPLWRLPSISGRVVDERGEPLVGVAVRAFTHAIIAGRRQLVGSTIVTTDDRGIYAMAGLKPGRYIVSVLSVQSTVLATTPESPTPSVVGELLTGGVGGGRPGAISGPGIDLDGRHRLALTNYATPPPPAATQNRAYAAQFYPGAPTSAEAAEIALAYRQSQQGIDFQMRPVPAVRVGGRVDGPAAPGLMLRLMPAGSESLPFGSEAATTVMEADGTFMFFNVPAGRYTLLAQSSLMDFTIGEASTRLPDAPGYSGAGVGIGSRNGIPGVSYLSRSGAAAPAWGRMAVTVGTSNIDNLSLTMHPVTRISGRIEFAEGVQAPANARFVVQAEPANGDPTQGFTSAGTTFANGAHVFSLQGLIGGSYLVSYYGGANGLLMMNVTVRGRDVTDLGIDTSTGDVDDVVINMTDKRQEVRGVVSGGAEGRPLGVIVFPADRMNWINYGWDAPRFRTTRAASNGAFRVQSLPAGDYFLIAVDAARLNDWTDPTFLAAASLMATRVSIDWGETKSQDLVFKNVVVK